MTKSLTSKIGAFVCLLLCGLQAFGGTVTGVVQNAAGGPVRNGTFSFTLTAPATIAGTATVVTSSVPCYTDGNGNVAGEPDPLLAPSLSVNLGSGTLAAGTYFVKIVYYDATGSSFPSPEASITLSAPGTLIVNAPIKQPANASGYKVYISLTTGTETLQGTVTGTPGTWGNFSQSVVLVAGAALPVSNGTICTLRFNDELTPSFTCYDVGLTSSVGANIPGYPAYWYLNGGSAGTINVGSGTPQSNVCQGQGVVYPQAIVSLPPFNATQTVNGGLNLNGFGLSAGNGTFSGTESVTGNVTEITGQNQYKAFSINSVLWVDGIKYTTIGAALVDCPASGGKIEVPPNWVSSESSWTGKQYCVIHHNGPCVVNFAANTITVAAGVAGFAVESDIPEGSAFGTLTSGCEYTYTGTSTFITAGASSADTHGFRLKNLGLNLNNAGSAAVALDVVRVTTGCELSNLHIIGPGGAITQQGIIVDGTGNYAACVITEPHITGVFKDIQFTGSGVNAGNANKVYGGQLGSPASGTSLGIDFEAGSSGNSVNGTDVENHAVGYNFGGTSQGNFLAVRSESNTSGATLGASTLQNEVHLLNSTDPITDSGTNNLTFTLGGTTHGAILTQPNNSNNVTLLNFQDAVGPLTGNGADQTVYTYTLPGATLAKAKGVRVKTWFIHGTGTASVTYKVSFGASAVVNTASATTGNGYAEVTVMNTVGSTSAQRASGIFNMTGVSPVLTSGVAPSETTASNVVIKLTFNVANTDQVTGGEWVVELIQ